MADFYAMQTRIKRMLAYEAEQQNPVLGDGEPLYESDTGGLKIGNGNSRYNDLKYTGIVVTSGQLKLTGIVDTWEELPTGQNGDVYLVREDGRMYTFVGSAWQPKGSGATIKGDTGPKGDRGDTGLKGDKGDRGDIGPKGDQGLPGLQGAKGDRGDTGLQGQQGLKGDVGSKGDQGIQGIQGPQGIQGLKGDKGDTGNGIAVAAVESSPGAEIGYTLYTDQFTATTANWETIPGFEVTLPTAERPVYLTLDLGLLAVEGAVESATSINYRILDLTHGRPIAGGYATADRRSAGGTGSEYLLTQSVPLTARLAAGLPDTRYVVQVQLPADQVGPAWYLNVSWAEGIDLIFKAVIA